MVKNIDIFGVAMADFMNGLHSENIIVHSSIAEDDEIPIPYLFRTFDQMPSIEQKALQLCKGAVLDIGSGAGSHSLWLQERGLGSILDHNDKYDTLLLLMNGTGIFERINKVDSYLQHLKSLLNPGGQILIDGSDIAYMFEDEDGGFWLDTHRDYYGEVTYTMSYKGKRSTSFDWLYLDHGTKK